LRNIYSNSPSHHTPRCDIIAQLPVSNNIAQLPCLALDHLQFTAAQSFYVSKIIQQNYYIAEPDCSPQLNAPHELNCKVWNTCIAGVENILTWTVDLFSVASL